MAAEAVEQVLRVERDGDRVAVDSVASTTSVACASSPVPASSRTSPSLKASRTGVLRSATSATRFTASMNDAVSTAATRRDSAGSSARYLGNSPSSSRVVVRRASALPPSNPIRPSPEPLPDSATTTCVAVGQRAGGVGQGAGRDQGDGLEPSGCSGVQTELAHREPVAVGGRERDACRRRSRPGSRSAPAACRRGRRPRPPGRRRRRTRPAERAGRARASRAARVVLDREGQQREPRADPQTTTLRSPSVRRSRPAGRQAAAMSASSRPDTEHAARLGDVGGDRRPGRTPRSRSWTGSGRRRPPREQTGEDRDGGRAGRLRAAQATAPRGRHARRGTSPRPSSSGFAAHAGGIGRHRRGHMPPTELPPNRRLAATGAHVLPRAVAADHLVPSHGEPCSAGVTCVVGTRSRFSIGSWLDDEAVIPVEVLVRRRHRCCGHCGQPPSAQVRRMNGVPTPCGRQATARWTGRGRRVHAGTHGQSRSVVHRGVPRNVQRSTALSPDCVPA